MDNLHETIITTEIDRIKVTVDHLLDVMDDEEQYTGRYRVTFGNGKVTYIEQDGSGAWIETGTGATDLSKSIGEMIENYVE